MQRQLFDRWLLFSNRTLLFNHHERSRYLLDWGMEGSFEFGGGIGDE